MNFPIPSFIPVPSAETMQLISIISLIVGICVTVAGAAFLFLSKRKGNKKNTLAWILVCVGVLLIANHGMTGMYSYFGASAIFHFKSRVSVKRSILLLMRFQ